MAKRPDRTTGDSANERLLDRNIGHSIMLERLAVQQQQEFIGLTETALLLAFTRVLSTRLVSSLDRSRRAMVENQKVLTEMRRDFREIRVGFATEFNSRLRASLTEIAVAEARIQTGMMIRVLPGLPVPPSAALLNAIATEQPFRGRLLREWVQGVALGTEQRVLAAVRQGLVEGDSIDTIVRRVRGTSGRGFTDGVYNTTINEVRMVVRTAVNHFTTAAREITYETNADLVKGVMFVATLDARTSRTCIALDGSVYPVGVGPRPPMHPNCRSTTSPILRSFAELGLNPVEFPEGTRASMNGEVPDSLTYPEWLRRQPAEVVYDVLGPRLGKLFRQGRLTVDSFVDENFRPLTIREILDREGISM